MAKETTKKVASNVEKIKLPKPEEVEVNESVEYKKMQEEIATLKKAIDAMLKNTPIQTKAGVEEEIFFVSLYNGTLNLCTEKYGGGNTYTFTNFGEEQAIPLADAKLILRINKSFAQEGLFYVQSEELVKSNGLQTAYKQILTKEKMEELFVQNKESFTKIFEGMTKTQQEVIADVLLIKMFKKENVDMNLVSEINRILERDLSSEAENSRQIYKQEK